MTAFYELISDMVENFDENRQNLFDRFKDVKDEISIFEEDLILSKEIEAEFEEFEIISKIENFDFISFVQIDIRPKDNVLFGEITRAIEDAVVTEVNEMMNVNENTAARNATPDILKDSYIIKKNELLKDVIFDDSLGSQKNMMTIRCLELYSEMSQTVSAISERSKNKLKEHQELLMFIGVTPKPNSAVSESNMSEVVSYTIAIASNFKDGNLPDIEKYKQKVVAAINNGINSIPNSSNVKSSIESFYDVSKVLETYSDKLKDVSNSSSLIKTIDALKQACEEGAKKIEKVYDSGMEM